MLLSKNPYFNFFKDSNFKINKIKTFLQMNFKTFRKLKINKFDIDSFTFTLY